VIMSVLTAFQWPVSFYQGGLLGLNRQVLFNGLAIFFSTLSSGGAALVLWRVSRTPQVFFMWLVVVNAIKVVLLAILLWKSLPDASRPTRFDFERVRSIWHFAAGMSGIAAFALILTQLDKVILSRLLDLKTFGYYAVAGMFGTGLSMIVASVFNTIFPRFSALVAGGNEDELKRFYHRCTQLMAVFILPLAAVLALFSIDILQFWTRNAEVARNAGPIATLLVIGSALNGLMNLPYALQLAHGWTSIGLRITIFLIIFVVPAIWFMATSYGAVGAAWVWAALNCIYMAVGVPLTHRRLLKGEARQWFGEIALPLVSVLLIVFVGKGLLAASLSTPAAICALLVLLSCAMGAAALVSPTIRVWLVIQVWRAKI